jgi:hypothetical protein
MQEICYESSGYIIPSYPQLLEAYDTAGWEGWVKSPAEGGAVLLDYANIDTYLFAQPRAGVAEDGGFGSGGLVAIIAAVLVVAGIVIGLLVRRRRPRATEE